MQGNQSEVARLQQQIKAEYAAAQQALYGVAMVGYHAFISARQENIGRHFETLSTILGSKEKAIKVVAETLESL